jgi:hypothetical protein
MRKEFFYAQEYILATYLQHKTELVSVGVRIWICIRGVFGSNLIWNIDYYDRDFYFFL